MRGRVVFGAVFAALLLVALPAAAQTHTAMERADAQQLRLGQPPVGSWNQTITAFDDNPERSVGFWFRRRFTDIIRAVPGINSLWKNVRASCEMNPAGSQMWSYCGSVETTMQSADGQAVGLNVTGHRTPTGLGHLTGLHLQVHALRDALGTVAAEIGVWGDGPDPRGRVRGLNLVAKSRCGDNVGERESAENCEESSEITCLLCSQMNAKFRANALAAHRVTDRSARPGYKFTYGVECDIRGSACVRVDPRSPGAALDTGGRPIILGEDGLTLSDEIARLEARIEALEEAAQELEPKP